MKKFMLSAAGLASVALVGSATAATVDFEVSGPGGTVSDVYGTAMVAGEVAIAVEFTNSGGWTWAGDLLIAFTDSNGNSVEYGGYNLTFGHDSIGDFSASWDSSSSGAYAGTIDLSGSGLADVASIQFMDGYSSGASTDHWAGSITGADIPAPGALALLGLAGLAGRRRRR